MKKKILFGLLMITLIVLPLLGACAEPTPAPAPTPTPAPTPAPTPTTEVIQLRFATFTPELGGCNDAKHIMDFIEEKSGGRVKFERFWGGVLGGPPEMLDLISSGSIDFTLLMHVMFKEQLPLHNFPEYQKGGSAKTMDYINKLNFEIPETAALMEKEFEANNIKGLNWNFNGENGMWAKMVFNSLADLKGKKMGSMKEQKALTQLGLNVVSVTDTDTYEALSRGVCECAAYPIGAGVNNKWQEVTKCYMFDGLFHGGWQATVNLDTWNKLPADIQKIFIAAGDDMESWGIECSEAQTKEDVQTCKDAGLVVGQLPDADTETLLKLNHELDAQDMQALAAKIGKTEEVNVILKYVNEITWGE